MRKSFIVCGFLMMAAGAAKAQEGRGFDVAGTYQYVRINPGQGAPGANCQGGAGSFGAYLTPRVGVVADLGYCKVTGLPSGTSSSETNFLFGPRAYFPAHGRVSPYVQALFGGERASASISGIGSGWTNAGAMTRGSAADIDRTRNVSFRAIQVEYFYTHFGGASQNNLRLQSGLVWRIGR